MIGTTDNAMPRVIEEIAADFDSLSDSDFDPTNKCGTGYERLSSLCDELRATNDPATSVTVLFRTMERLDNEELGSPGPLVHAFESWRGSYEAMLAESVRRKPVRLSVWMVNRIMNEDPPNAEAWLGLLRCVTEHAAASAAIKAQAEDIIKFQAGRTNSRT